MNDGPNYGMSESLTPRLPNRRVSRTLIGIVAGFALVVIGAAYFFLSQLGLVPMFWDTSKIEDTARYYPPDTWIYGTVSLLPSGSQRRHMIDMWRRWDDSAAASDITDDYEDLLEDETGFDIERDVMDWMGSEMSFGVTDLDFGYDAEIEFATVIDVRDYEAADRFLDDLFDYFEEWSYAEVSRESDYEGFRVWSSNDELQMRFGLSEDALVVGNDDAFFEVLERVGGSGLATLADDPQFRDATGRFAEPRFATIYADWDALQLRIFSLPEVTIAPSDIPLVDGSIEWIALNAGIHDRAVVISQMTPLLEPLLETRHAPVEEWTRPLHSQTAAYFGAAMTLDMDDWRDSLRQYSGAEVFGEYNAEDLAWETNRALGTTALDANSNASDYLDALTEWVSDSLGMNVETELLDLLTGSMVMAMESTNLSGVVLQPDDFPLNAIVALPYRAGHGNDVSDAVRKLEEYAWNTWEIGYYQSDVGGDEFATYFADFPEPYELGWLVSDGYAVFGTTEQSLTNTVATLRGENESVTESGAHARVMRHMPDNAFAMAYVDLRSITNDLDADDLNVDYESYAAFRDIADAAAFSMHNGPDHSSATLAISLFPDD